MPIDAPTETTGAATTGAIESKSISAPGPTPISTRTCSHCGLPVPAARIEPQRDQQFCCHGCEAVYETLHSCGLTQYYRIRASLGVTADTPIDGSSPTDGDRFAIFDSEAFHNHHVTESSNGLRHVDLNLQNVHCGACLWLIERLPRVCDGVAEARLSLRHAVARVTWDPNQVSLSKVAEALTKLGYPPSPHRSAGDTSASSPFAHRRDEERKHWIRIALAAACAGNTMLLSTALYAGWFDGMESQYVRLFRALSAGIGLLALFGPGIVFFRGAFAALRVRTVNLDVPIAIALGVGGVAGLVNTVTGHGELYFDSLAVLVLLLLVGRYLQYRQQRWADDTVGLMLRLTPSTCRVVRAGETMELPVEALTPNDTLEVRAGELIAADGVVQSGTSAIDKSLLTGESRPEPVTQGDEVYSGTRNASSTLQINVTRVGEDTRVGRLMQRVTAGVGEKPAIVQMADRIAGVFVIAVVAIAAAVFAWWLAVGVGVAVNHTVALLIVACPCALALTTPLTLAIATGVAAQRDILIKRAAVLEVLPRGGRVWFDKTGTLTEGRLQLAEWIGPDWLRGIVAMIEAESTHPIGRALEEALGNDEPTAADRMSLTDRQERGDGGITAKLNGQLLLIGSPRFIQSHDVALSPQWCERVQACESAAKTTILIALDGNIAALAALADTPRDEAATTINTWRQSRWSPGVLSGDARPVVEAIANTVGIESASSPSVVAEVTPEEKLDAIRASRDAHQRVVMIGDGVNDAAALAAADVGIAVRGGAEAAMSAADVYIARPGLGGVHDLLSLARHTTRVIRLNLTVSLAYNITAVALAAAGLVNPLVAAVLMPISSSLGLAIAVGGMSRWRQRRFAQ